MAAKHGLTKHGATLYWAAWYGLGRLESLAIVDDAVADGHDVAAHATAQHARRVWRYASIAEPDAGAVNAAANEWDDANDATNDDATWIWWNEHGQSRNAAIIAVPWIAIAARYVRNAGANGNALATARQPEHSVQRRGETAT